MSEYELLWQVTPIRLIRFATEQASKNTDFDKQIAYVILDLGVETIFKVFLEQYGHKELKNAQKQKDGRELSFHDIIDLVKQVAGGKLQNIKIENANYFHKKRNEIYHQRVSFPPLQDDLEGYLQLAKTLLMALFDVDLGKSQEYSRFSLARIQKNIRSLQSNSSLLVEHLYPQIATRKIEAQLRYIRTNTGPDDESYPPSVRAEFVQQRVDAFNEITGWELTEDDYEFIEYIIDNPEQLHVWLAFQELGDGWHEDWKKYQDAVYFLRREQNIVNIAEDKKYEEIYKWTHEKADIVCEWLKSRIPDIEPKNPDSYYPPLIFDP